MKNDVYYIKHCELLAEEAAAKGDAPVGSIITKGDEIIAESIEASKNKNDITCHAELEAIRLAVKNLKTNDLSDCVIYSTHEPCIMCSYAIRFYKIKKVVYQHAVNYLGGNSSSMPLLISKEVPPHWEEVPVIVHLKTFK
ncbi:nucleoside deaminase [Ginsengibacter hankyongi]|uniref:Nucleoside deaminase n=1 Tax=Ginsengibacter hankyongi TaxID=2607284 RepID=A0A5J5IHQ8_9BACT|nr:nucleoside deaminase [Ginsengibacter hankyongi]KAA9040530.1 nucleoside deaminase [Ginsengibacter hankyongi]